MLVMLLVAPLVPFLLATRVAANPFAIRGHSSITLPITKRVDTSGAYNPIQRDQQRRRSLMERGRLPVINVPLNNTVFAYTASIGVGASATPYELAVDSVTADIWVGANAPYVPSKNSRKTPDTVHVNYGDHAFFGIEYIDTVRIAPDVEICQSIGVASNSTNVKPLDGIMGIGPKTLTIGSLSPDNTTVIPTVMDSLFEQGKIEHNLVALSFAPTNSAWTMNGEITFGGTDRTKYTGEITYSPVPKTGFASQFWGVDAAFRYGNASVTTGILNATSGVLDSGATLFGLATDSYNLYVKQTGAVFDNTTGLLSITEKQYENLQSLFFDVDGTRYEFNANAQLWPRPLNTLIGGEEDGFYLVVADLGPKGSARMGFVLGVVFMERFYVVYDTTNHSVGLATTRFTSSTNFN